MDLDVPPGDLPAEARKALAILAATGDDLATIDRLLPPEARGPELSRALAMLDLRLTTAVRCIEDGLATHGQLHPPS